MAKTETRLPLLRAQQLAAALVEELRPGCERIEIAGSIRRKRPDVGDIELVAIPRRAVDLMGAPTDSLLDPILARLVKRKQLATIKNGDLFKQFELVDRGVRLDLFLCEPETWGCIFTIRTGDANFSHRLVTKKAIGGLCPSHLSFSGGRLWTRGKSDELVHVPTPEETDVFAALGLEWIPPEKRS